MFSLLNAILKNKFHKNILRINTDTYIVSTIKLNVYIYEPKLLFK